MKRYCSPAYSITIGLSVDKTTATLADLITAIDRLGGEIHTISTMNDTPDTQTRQIVVKASDTDHQRAIIAAAANMKGIKILSVSEDTFACHESGKIGIDLRYPLRDTDDLSRLYTPGVARLCKAIEADPLRSFRFTMRSNTVAIVTDGSAILGLGNLGAVAALPVMEGKAMLFKCFAGIDAIPLCLEEHSTDGIVAIVKAIAPTFGGINLEDISAPRCFEIEQRLREELDIPVFHDDQHGTAIVVLAALTNALKVVGKDICDIKIVFSGVGAAGTACTELLLSAGAKNIIGCDRAGALYLGREEHMNPAKQRYAQMTNPERLKGSLSEVIAGADVFIGLSGPGILTIEDVRRMADNPIVFAMSNPDPEIPPEIARPEVAVMATGRSDYPNQINNVLAFPGVFRGALDSRAMKITEAMKISAAKAIASCVPEERLCADCIIPSVLDEQVVPRVADAVKTAAEKEGITRPISSPVEGVDDLLPKRQNG